MRITYKFKSGSTEDVLECDGNEISVGEAKRRLIEKHHLKSEDYTLLLFTSNDEEITDAEFIADGACLTLRRVPSVHASHPARPSAEADALGTSVLDVDSDPYAAMMPHPAPGSDSSTTAPKFATENVLSPNANHRQSAASERFQGHGGYRGPTCYHCGEPGHRINECPTNPNAAYYRNRNAQLKAKPKEPENEIPSSMKCRLCHNLFEDPVIVSCCGDTFCSRCFEEAVKRNDHRCPNVQCREKVELVGHTFPNSRIRDLVADYRLQHSLHTAGSSTDALFGGPRPEATLTLPQLGRARAGDPSGDGRRKGDGLLSTPERGDPSEMRPLKQRRASDTPDVSSKRLAVPDVVLSREEFEALKAQQLKSKGQAPAQAKSPERDPPRPTRADVKPPAVKGPIAAPAGPRRRYAGECVVRAFPFVSSDGGGVVQFIGRDNPRGEWLSPVESKEVRVCASSMDKAVSGGLQQILDAEAHSTGCFQTEDAPYSWVILDFGERSVRPMAYTFGVRGPAELFPRAWQFEGSEDNDRWVVLSRHDGDESLCPQRRRASWAIQTALFFRYFRLVLDPAGNSAAGGALALNGLELHGELRAPPAGVAPAYRSPPLVPGTMLSSLPAMLGGGGVAMNLMTPFAPGLMGLGGPLGVRSVMNMGPGLSSFALANPPSLLQPLSLSYAQGRSMAG
eukprot:EG_transcript_2768